MKLSMKKIVNQVKNYIMITFGLFVYVLGWVAFLIPAKIVGSGVSGIGTIIYFATGLPVGYSNFIINGILVLIAMRLLGAKFGLNTIFGIVTSSFLFVILQPFVTEPIIDDVFMSAILGAAMSGAGVGITISYGGNSGGTDIIALIVNKYRNISPGRVILYCDVVIISSSYFIMHSLETVIYGYVVMAVSVYAIDLVLEGSRQSYQIMIMSENFDVIASRITKETGRGVTLLHGKGWYTQEQSEIVMVIARKYDKPKIFKILNEEDKKAFVSVARVMGVFGENFDKIKHK